MKKPIFGKMVNISLDEATELYYEGFQSIALRAYSFNELKLYTRIKNFKDVASEIAMSKDIGCYETKEFYQTLLNEHNPLIKLMLINKAMHLSAEDHLHHYFLNKFGQITKREEPSTLDNKTFCFVSEAMTQHVWKYFKK